MNSYDIYKELNAGKYDSGLEIIRDITTKEDNGFTQHISIVRPVKQPSSPSPAILYFHGGGFEVGSPEATINLGKYLALKLGITFFTASYRLYKGTPTYPGLLHDSGDAWRWIQHNADKWNIDPQQVAIGGSSAGGYISTMTTVTLEDPNLAGKGTLPPVTTQPKCLVCMWAPLDLEARWFDRGQKPGPEIKLFGNGFAENPVAYYQANPLAKVKPGLPPALFLYGSQDKLVAPRQGELGSKAWTISGNHAEMYIYDNIGHDTVDDNGQSEIKAWDKTVEFLQKQFS